MINLGMELSSLKLHHTSRLLVAVLVAALVACSAGSLSNSTDQTPEEPGETNGTSQDRLSGIPVNGNLVFSKRVQLSFAVSGEVGEILVREGDRVVAGQTLARLDSETVAALEANLSQTRFELDQAEEALDIVREEFRTTPLELSKFLNYGAEARGRLDDAERELEDFERDYVEDLARAQSAKADVEVRLDRAREDLEDFLSDYDQDLTDALQAKARADTQLDNAREALGDFHLDERRDVVGAWNIVSNRFEVLVLAEDRLTEFLNAPVGIQAGDDGDEDQGPRTISGGEEDFGEGPYLLEELRPAEGIADLRRLKAHVALAKVNLEKAYDDHLEELQRGEDPLLLAELEAKVETAESRQAQAIRDLERELEGADRLELQRRQAEVEEAEARLAQTERDLEEELEGPDKFELEVRKKEVARQLEFWIDFIDGPDPYLVNAKQADVKIAQEALSEALEDLEGATIRAPFDGVVSAINVDLDDRVNHETRMMELIDLSQVEVDGIVDAADIERIAVGSGARITIASLPGMEFEGAVTAIAETPRTERGSQSYPVKVRVQLPDGIEVPARVTVVSTMVLAE